MNPNYSKMLEKEIQRLDESGVKPRLLLHSCCAPCSSYVMEYLREHFRITVFYYNPNITAEKEYSYRLAEEKKILEAPYDPKNYLEAVKGYEDCLEGGDRCGICFEMRLRKTAEEALRGGYDCFTTTLTISPLKNAARLNEIGERVGSEYGVRFLPSDFKKKNGYKRSIELSREFDLYRQNFCGCAFSRREAPEREAVKNN